MIRFYSIFIAGVLSIVSINAMADIRITFGSVPANREVVAPPRGYATCHTVAAGFRHQIWVNQHTVCKYPRNRGKWISGHWQCIQGIPQKGICMRWDWVPSYWENARVNAYNPPMPGRPHAYPSPNVAYAPSPVPRPSVPVPVPGMEQPSSMPVPGVGQPPAERA